MKINLIGRPNASHFHPDHIPTKFPAVYKQSQPSVEQQSGRLKRAIDRQVRVQQAINVQQVKKDAEKESMKERQREQSEARDAERRRKREEKENDEQVRLAERQLRLQKAKEQQEAKRGKEKQRRQTKQAKRKEKKKLDNYSN